MIMKSTKRYLPNNDTRVVFVLKEDEECGEIEHFYNRVYTGNYHNDCFYNDDYEGYMTVSYYRISEVECWCTESSFLKDLIILGVAANG